MKTQSLLRCAIVSSAALIFAACATNDVESDPESESETDAADSTIILSNSYWRLTQLGEAPIDNPPNGHEIRFSMEYQEKKIVGFAGCNRFFGHYEMNGEAIRIDQIGSTRMFCEGCMDLEQKFLSMFGETASWKIDDGSLQLFDASGNSIATFAGTMD